MGKTYGFACRRRIALHQGTVSGWQSLVWLPCIEATSATLFLEILYIQLQIPGDKRVTLEKIISELDTLKQPRLIVS